MRNLKRTLSLVLAAAMLIGMMVVSASAVEFKDQADISYDEAVSVMAEMGILEGNNGSFDPTGILTREQAAKIITYVVMGKEKAEKLAASSTFDDVKATDWAAKYIAYCSAKNIIAGDGTGKFNPKGELTGFAFGKMLLVALGFDPAACGLTGGNWEINTSTLLAAEKLDAGLESVVLGSSMTREQAAQLALNAMKWSTTPKVYEVRYTDDNKATYTVAGTFDSLMDATLYANVLGKWTTGNPGYYAEQASPTDTLLKKVHSVTENASAVDAFGRPGTSYSKTGWDAPLFFADEPVLTYTTAVTGGKLYTDLGKPASATYSVLEDNYPTTAYNATVSIASGNTGSIGGNGVVTEVYKTATTGVYKIVLVNYYVGTIATHVDAVKDSNGDITAKEYVTLTQDSTKKPGVALTSSGKFETTSFTKADATANTVVLYTASYNGTTCDVKSVTAAEKVENVAITSTTSTKVNDYVKSAQATSAVTGTITMTGGATYNLFLDGQGNVIHLTTYTAGASTDYVMVTANSATAQGDGTVEAAYWNVRYVDMNGNQSLIKVADNSGLKDTAGNAVTKTDIYTVSEDTTNTGYSKLVKVTSVNGTAANNVLNKTQPTIASGIVANAETVFVLQTSDSPVTFKTVTGLANVPSYTSVSTKAYAVKGTDGYADVVFLDVHSATPAATSAANVIYLLTKAGDAYDADQKVEYDVYNAVVDGVLTTVKVKNGETMTSLENKLVEVKQLNANGFMESGSGYTAAVSTGYLADQSINAAVKYSAPTLTAESGKTYTVAADAVVYMINANDQLTVGTVADLVCSNANGKITYVYASATDTTVTAIYFDGTITK